MFYEELINAFADIAIENDGRELIEEVLESLKDEIERMEI